MKSPYGAIAAIALIVALVWFGPSLKAQLVSAPAARPSPTVKPSPKPVRSEPEQTPEPEPTLEPEQTPAPESVEAWNPKSGKCRDGSAMTITDEAATQAKYKCESGAYGAFFK